MTGSGQARPPALENVRVGIIGLGYVGLPLAVYMARHFPVLGFDVNKARIGELAGGRDRTGEVTDEEFAAARTISFTADIEALRDCNFYIVTVPTPIDQAKRPDLTALMRASETVGRVLSPGDVVVYEFDGLSWRHGRGLRADPGEGVWAHLQPRLLRRLFTGAHQSRRFAAPAPHHRQGHLGLDAGRRRPRRQGLWQRGDRRHPQGELGQSGGSRQGHREHSARREHRADQRACHAVQGSRARHQRGACRRRHQMEFSRLSPWPRRRPLHRRRSLLSDPQGAIDRLPPGDDPCRAPHQ